VSAVDPAGLDEQQLSVAFSEARAAWPGITLDSTVFARHLEARLAAPQDPTAAAATAATATPLSALHTSDLYLACACEHGDPAAIARFEQRFLSQVPSFLARTERSPQVIEDVRQLVATRLLVTTPDARPKIAEYSGRGPLLNWLRVVTVRIAVSAGRKRQEVVGRVRDAGENNVEVGRDPEVEYLKGRYRALFEAALKATLAALPVDQRNVLRLHFVEGLNIDEIGAVHGVHRATAARWIAAAREAILEGTRKRLRDELELTASEFESIVRLVSSQLEVSLRGALGTGEPSG
jgi:RNA polymerase sigma-70 factor, ECF subfamily